MDGTDLIGAEQVSRVGGERGDATAVEGDDAGGQHDEQGRRGASDETEQCVEHHADTQVHHVGRLAAEEVRRGRPDETAAHVEDRQQSHEPGCSVVATVDVPPWRKKSWIIVLACSRMPIPAVTLQNSTVHNSQNWGVLIALDAEI